MIHQGGVERLVRRAGSGIEHAMRFRHRFTGFGWGDVALGHGGDVGVEVAADDNAVARLTRCGDRTEWMAQYDGGRGHRLVSQVRDRLGRQAVGSVERRIGIEAVSGQIDGPHAELVLRAETQPRQGAFLRGE